MDFRRPWPFALFVLLAHVLSRFLSVAIHEFLGHSALAFLLGGSAYAVYVSPGSGITYVYLPEGTPVAGVVAMLAAGIAVETVVGVAIWWFTRRSASVAWRAFGVVAATVFIVYSLVYMAAGAFEGFPGDTWAIVSTLRDPGLAYGFAAVGGLWTVLVGVLLSFDLLRILGGPGRDLQRESLMLILFWLVPAPLAFLPGFSAFNALEESPVLYIGAFAALLIVVPALLLYLDLLPPPRVPGPPAPLPWRSIAAVGLPLLFLVPVWVGVFGVSQPEATGLLLETPPVQVESAWLGGLAVNLEVVVHENFTVSVVWRFHGTFTPSSPLEKRIVSSFENRMDHDFYDRAALTIVGDAFNESGWIVNESDIHPSEFVWSAGVSYPNELNPAGVRVVRLVPSALNGLSFLARSGRNLTVTVHDPFKFEPTTPSEGWLDAFQVTWQGRLVLVGWAASGGTAAETRSANFIRWRPYNRLEADDTYQVEVRLP